MLNLRETQSQSKESIVKFFFTFIICVGSLFLFVSIFILLPKVDNSFNKMNTEANSVATTMFSNKLNDYINYKQLALEDMSSSPIIVNATLLGDTENSALKDLISHSSLLGEDPKITIIDAVGDILFSESTTQPDFDQNFQWVIPLLTKNKGDSLLKIYERTSRIEIAVPIIFGKKSEGVIIASIDGNPIKIFNEDFLDHNNFGILYSKDNNTIASPLQHINVPNIQKVILPKYDLEFTYISDHSFITDKKNDLMYQLVFSIFAGMPVILLLLFILGRKLILTPYNALATSQQTIALAVEGISTIDISGLYISVNDAYAKTYGYTPHELEGRNWLSTIVPDDHAQLNKTYELAKSQGRASAEIRGSKKDNSVFYKHITLISQYDNKGTYIGLHCFMQDVTSIKSAEEKIHHQQQELQLIFDHVPLRIIYKDDQNRILRLNKQAAKSMGGTAEDFEGKSCYDLFPEMAKKYHDDDLEVINCKKAKLNIIEPYTPLNKPMSWVSTDKVPYIDPISNKAFLFVCIQDITPLKQAELKQKNLVEELSYINRELAQFAYIASHDLKSPLRGVEQLAEWVKEDCEDTLPEKSKKHLTLITSRIRRMSILLDDLLQYSRVSEIESLYENIHLPVILNQLLDLHVQSFDFNYTLDVPDKEILIERKPLEIIFRNLFDNAVKHHHKGKGNIHIKYLDDVKSHVFEITDDGPGIDPKMHEKAFLMFQTLKPRDEVEGSGMGLAIVKKILHRFKASIHIHSDGHSGTTFKIVWPKIHS